MKPSPLRRLLAQRDSAPAPAPAPTPTPAQENARALIAAIDAGGMPLHPAKVNQIARTLGLEVSREARVEATMVRIRACLVA